MPCDNGPYCGPTQYDIDLRNAHHAILYLQELTDRSVWIPDNSGRNDLDVRAAALCDFIGRMTQEEQERCIWDGRNAKARHIANWWEEHQRRDAIRIEEARQREQATETRQRALDKLTQAERLALGIK